MTARTDVALRAAMVRLLTGRPVRTDGRLTVSNLAREAKLARATVNRTTNVLQEFRVAIAKQQRRRHGPAGMRARVRELEEELNTQRKNSSEQNNAFRATAQKMAQHIQALTLHAVIRERELTRVYAELKQYGQAVVVPLTHPNRLRSRID